MIKLTRHGCAVAAPAPIIGRRRFAFRLRRAQGGVTAVEMAFIFPIFLLFLFGIIEFGRALWTQTALQFAVEAAARCAAVNGTTSTSSPCYSSSGAQAGVTSYAASQVYGLSVPTTDFTCTGSACASGTASCGISGYTNGVQVNASYTFNSVVGQLIPALSNITLTAMSCHP